LVSRFLDGVGVDTHPNRPVDDNRDNSLVVGGMKDTQKQQGTKAMSEDDTAYVQGLLDQGKQLPCGVYFVRTVCVPADYPHASIVEGGCEVASDVAFRAAYRSVKRRWAELARRLT
jgi:hypothetical protein